MKARNGPGYYARIGRKDGQAKKGRAGVVAASANRGGPGEIKNNERWCALTPAGARVLVDAGVYALLKTRIQNSEL